jgi:hypothetical protein
MTKEKTDIIFQEVQRFGLWLRLLLVFSMVAVAVIECFALMSMLARPDHPGSGNIVVLIVLGICLPLALCILFWTAKLVTEVRSDGLYIRFFPFHFRYKKIPVEDLHEYYARTYRPIIEYGGCGIRYSISGKSKAYNTTGNRGVQLIMKNGRKLLIGSQKAEELADAIGSLVQSA